MKNLLTAAAIVGISVAMPMTATAQDMTLVSGQFRDADSNHKGEGTATITKNDKGELVLSLTNFKSSNGPDLEVWLSASANVDDAGDVTGAKWLALGDLKSASGDQSYIIPAGTDIDQFKSAVIWCETYSVLFSAASLK